MQIDATPFSVNVNVPLFRERAQANAQLAKSNAVSHTPTELSVKIIKKDRVDSSDYRVDVD